MEEKIILKLNDSIDEIKKKLVSNNYIVREKRIINEKYYFNIDNQISIISQAGKVSVAHNSKVNYNIDNLNQFCIFIESLGFKINLELNKTIYYYASDNFEVGINVINDKMVFLESYLKQEHIYCDFPNKKILFENIDKLGLSYDILNINYFDYYKNEKK